MVNKKEQDAEHLKAEIVTILDNANIAVALDNGNQETQQQLHRIGVLLGVA